MPPIGCPVLLSFFRAIFSPSPLRLFYWCKLKDLIPKPISAYRIQVKKNEYPAGWENLTLKKQREQGVDSYTSLPEGQASFCTDVYL
jgi:hypothetical protein